MTRKLPEFSKDSKTTPFVNKGEEFSYFIEHPQQNSVFEFGAKEHFICMQLDGQTSQETVQRNFQKKFGVFISRRQLDAFIHKLNSEGFLAVTSDSRDTFHKYSLNEKVWHLFDPNQFFYWVAQTFSWLFSPFIFIILGCSLFFSFGIIVKFGINFWQEWGFLAKKYHFFAFTIFTIIAMNCLGEVAKGVACRYYKGQVHEFNLRFIYRLFPRFHCDITDAFYETEKSERIRIIAASMVCQIMVWTVSVIGWYVTVPWSVMHFFWSFLSFSSFIFILLNFNPLLHRDGYQLFRTWLDIYGFRGRAINYARSVVFSKPLPEPLSVRERRIFFWYGMLSWIFFNAFWLVFLGLAGFFLMSAFKGVGACLFLIVLVLRFEQQLKGLFMGMEKWSIGKIAMNERGSVKLRRLIQFSLLIVLAVILLLPYQYSVSGEFSLLPVNQYGIRTQVAGEITEVLVQEGQLVKKGDPIARLSGRQQERQLEESKATYEYVKAQLDLLRGGPKVEQIAKAEQEVGAARKSLEHSIKELERQEEMFKNKAVSEKEYDAAVRARDMDNEKLKIAIKNLELVSSGAQDEEIRSLEAQLRLTEVEVSFNEKDLELTTLLSPADGRVITAFPGQSVGQYLEKGELFAIVEDSSRFIVDIELAEQDISHIRIGAPVVIKMWADPQKKFSSTVIAVAPVAYEKSKGRVIRSLTAKESLIEREETLMKEGKVVRVLAELPNTGERLKTDMTGYAKITCETRPVYAVFFRWLTRFVQVEVWSWIP